MGPEERVLPGNGGAPDDRYRGRVVRAGGSGPGDASVPDRAAGSRNTTVGGDGVDRPAVRRRGPRAARDRRPRRDEDRVRRTADRRTARPPTPGGLGASGGGRCRGWG